MESPIILEGEPFNWETGGEAMSQVIKPDGKVNWFAAMAADPGVMSCPGCNEFLWREGHRVKCPHCGHEWIVR
jgi:hypothetical protein